MWAMSRVRKFRLVEAPKIRLPTNTNISIMEMPVMMSGFVMGMLVTVSRAARTALLRSLSTPTAAAVPMTVAITEADTATTRVFWTDFRVSLSRKSSAYHLRLKPEKTDRLLASLKENTSRMTMGAKRKKKIRAV